MESFNRFNHRVPRPTALLMIVAGLLLPYIGLGHIGSILGDECYQALCVRSYENAPLAMLSFYTGHVWTTIFGEGILQLRVLMVLCYQISVALPCIYLYRVSRRPLLSAFMFMMLSVGSRMTVLQLYGWDAGAYPFFSAAFLAFIHYASRATTLRAAILGAAIALAVMARVTLLSMLPIALVTVIAVRRPRFRAILADSLAGLGAFVVTALAVMIIMTGSVEGYAEAWTERNIITGHDGNSLSTYIYRIKILYAPVVMAWGPFFAAAASALFVSRVRRGVHLAAFAGILVTLLVTIAVYRDLDVQNYGTMFGLFQPMLLFFLLLVPMRYAVTGRRPECRPGLIVLTAALSAVMMIGSDSMLERPVTLVAIPVACALSMGAWSPAVRRAVMYMGTALIVFFFYQCSMQIKATPADMSRYDVLRGVYDTESMVERMEEMEPLIRRLDREERRWTFYGYNKKAYDYVLTDGTGYDLHHFHFADRPGELERLSVYARDMNDIIIVQTIEGIDMPELTQTIGYLETLGFRPVEEGINYTLYSRK